MTDTPKRPVEDKLDTDPSAELGLRSPVRDKKKLGDAQYSPTPPREALRPPEAPAGAENCPQCSTQLDRSRAVRSDASEYEYYFCDAHCRDRWQRDRSGRPAASPDE